MSINSQQQQLLDQIKWNDDGLVPVIAQDHSSKTVMMMAWMNAESLLKTIELGEVVYYSRSRQQLWHKGEQSGHTQKVHEIRLDCDNDVLLISIDQVGGIACHTGREHCFFRKLEDGEWRSVDAVKKDPSEIYNK
jgi:phosphoribosyl-AMP cyclohydrolase